MRDDLLESLEEAIPGVRIAIEVVDKIPLPPSGKQHPVIVEAA